MEQSQIKGNKTAAFFGGALIIVVSLGVFLYQQTIRIPKNSPDSVQTVSQEVTTRTTNTQTPELIKLSPILETENKPLKPDAFFPLATSAPDFTDHPTTEVCTRPYIKVDDVNYDSITSENTTKLVKEEVQKALAEAVYVGPESAGCYIYIHVPERGFRGALHLGTGNFVPTPFEPNRALISRPDSNLVIHDPRLDPPKYHHLDGKLPKQYFVLHDNMFHNVFKERCLVIRDQGLCGPEITDMVDQDELWTLADDDLGISFQYLPAVWGQLEFKPSDNAEYVFFDTEHPITDLNTNNSFLDVDSFRYGISASSREQLENILDLVAESDDASVGWVTGEHYDIEKQILESSESGIIDTCTNISLYCEIVVINGKRFLKSYTTNSWKGITTQLAYITYHKERRFEFTSTAFYTDEIAGYFGDPATWQLDPEFFAKIQNNTVTQTEKSKAFEKTLQSARFY